MKRILVAFITWLVPAILFSQEESPFRPHYKNDATRRISQTFTSSDTLSLEDLGTIYSLSIDATIQQPQESSFTRIVLEDKNGHDYLVAESDWFHNDTTIVNLSDYCEETAMLDGIEPAYLKCYLSNATLTIYSISSAPSRIQSVQNAISASDLKRQQVQNIVNRINTYNKKHGRLWEAGVTDMSLLPFEGNHFNNDSPDSYSNNIIYYSGGLYEVGMPRPVQPDRTVSPYIPSFDWRNRHGKRWLTSVKNQRSSSFCSIFAAVGMLESNMLLYKNDTTSIDLSEQYVASYMDFADFNYGTTRDGPIIFLKTDGTIDDDSMPFFNDANYVAPATRPEGEEHVYLNNYKCLPLNNLPLDSLKKNIIQNGPGVCGWRRAPEYTHISQGGHSMILAGYDTIVPDTIYIFFNGGLHLMRFQVNDSIIGHTYWIYKNSWGTSWGHNGYLYVIYYNDDNWYMGDYAYFPIGMPLSNISRNIICEDYDGDGYYNWGIGPRPANCPAWAPEEPDGDDSDATLGPMDEYGYCASIIPTDTIYIDTNEQYSSGYQHVTKNICIRNNSTLTVSSDLSMNRLAEICIKPGSTLIITGCIRNAKIKPEVGSTLILNNGGKIITHHSDHFELPVGAFLQINEGMIK